MEEIDLNKIPATVKRSIKKVKNVILLLMEGLGPHRRMQIDSPKFRRLGQVGESKKINIGFQKFPFRKESAIFSEVENLALGSQPSRLVL